MIESSKPVLDEAVFMEAQNFMNSKFSKIIGYYFEDTAAYIEIINKGASENDASAIIPVAHTIKSSSKQLGAEKLSYAAEKLEEMARLCVKGEESIFQVVTLAHTVEPIFIETMDKIKKIIAEQK